MVFKSHQSSIISVILSDKLFNASKSNEKGSRYRKPTKPKKIEKNIHNADKYHPC